MKNNQNAHETSKQKPERKPRSLKAINRIETVAYTLPAILVIAAMIFVPFCLSMAGQGSWAEGEILRSAPDFKLGFCGNPVSENAADCKVELGTSQAVCIWKDSKVLQAALDFANWWNTSDYGKSWYADSIITYPPLTDAKIPTSALTTDALASIQEKGAGAMSIYQIPAAIGDGTLPQIMQNYATGSITKDEACQQLDDAFMEFADQ